MTDQPKDIRAAAATVRDALGTMLSELRLQAHLASMEARTALEDLDPQLSRISARLAEVDKLLSGTTDEASLHAHLAMMDAKDRWESLLHDINGVADSVKRRGDDAKGAIDRARLHGHLARLDAEDEIERRREKMEASWRTSRDVALDEGAAFVERMRGNLARIRERLSKDEG